MSLQRIPDGSVGNTLVDYPRLLKLIYYTDYANSLPQPGEIAEVGVYKGGTALLLCSLAKPKQKVYLFDTFEGMPPVSPIDLHKQGDFADTSIEHVKGLLKSYDNHYLYKGIFPHTNSIDVMSTRFSLVHLDVDIYTSVKDCLNFFLPRMVRGGIIVLDDYNEPNCPGAKLAADEFVKANRLEVKPTVQSQAIIQVLY